jgi:NAD(P)-dependent dehydrogenase (short-subunit alcohol dehydrogenase family)
MSAGTGSLSGKVGLVTGGATILGQGVVTSLADGGARVCVLDVADAGQQVVDGLGRDDVRFLHTDVTDDAALSAAFADTLSTWGRIDFLVNLACRYDDHGAESTRAQWGSALEVNLISAARAATLVRPLMAQTGGGAIVNISSVSSKVAQAGRWVYPASKAALVQLTRSMALDLAADGIRVNSVSPGWTWSAVMDSLSGSDRVKTDRVAAPFHVLGRVADAVEVGAVVAFLCGDTAAFVTGADWAADGGYSSLGPEQGLSAIPQLTL